MTELTAPTTIDTITPIGRGAEAAELATAAYTRLFELLDRLDASDWRRPTDCTGWTVDDVVGHLLGAARGHASLREMVRQMRYGDAHAGDFDGSSLDAMNDLQVRDHAELPPAEKVAALRRVAPRAVRRRTGLPRPLRRLPVPLPDTGSMPPGLPSSVPLGRLNDVILTRDVLMHRIDIARAAGVDHELDGVADRRVVADVVAEWGRGHGRPVELHLLGPAGGTYRRGDGPVLELTAADFCRAVSGRDPAGAPLDTYVLF